MEVPPLPEELLRHIFSLLPQPTLVQCRLLNRASGALATALAFRHVRLEVLCDTSPFMHISTSPKLRQLVREVTIGIEDGVVLSHLGTARYQATLLRHASYLVTLPRLRMFTGLQALHLRFTTDNVRRRVRGGRGDYGYLTRVLGVVVACLTGSWSEACHEAWQTDWLDWCASRTQLAQEPASDGDSTPGLERPADLALLPFSPAGALRAVTSLTIANLPDAIEAELYASPAFQTFLSSHPLRELKMLVSLEQNLRHPAESIFLPGKYDFFEQLPATWLSPALTSHLRVLSLFCDQYFGWAPKLDLRALGPGPALPNLRVLALGNYVFSHAWQADWIASLGSGNGRGGLEELYLDDCPILWRARTPGPLDDSILDSDGVRVENAGYPIKEVMTTADAQRPDPITVDFPLRWAPVLRTWRRRMTALKVLRMGSGDWEGDQAAMVTVATTMHLAGDTASRQKAQTVWRQRSEAVIHLNYDKPSPTECGLGGRPKWGLLQGGVGMETRREHLLQYVHFDVGLGPTPWVERDFKLDMLDQEEDGWQRYEAVRGADEEAWRDITEAIASR